jgi:DNA-binding winged helix-turn-helix (wHTH) protein
MIYVRFQILLESTGNKTPRATAAMSSNLASFGAFELDLKAGELLKDGQRIRLNEQPFQLLKMLLESSGEVVTREDIRKKLWPNGIVVEFDHSINAATQKLRQALGDSAKSPEYIETVGRRGYRWLTPVEWRAPVPATSLQSPVADDSSDDSTRTTQQLQRKTIVKHVRLFATVGVLAVPGIAAAIFVAFWRPSASNLALRQRQLTSNFADQGVVDSSISPDGKYLAYADRKALFLKLLETGETKEIPRPAELGASSIAGGSWEFAWFPGSTRFAASARLSGHCTMWEFSVLGGTARKLRDDACLQSISPNGKLISFSPTEAFWGIVKSGS